MKPPNGVVRRLSVNNKGGEICYCFLFLSWFMNGLSFKIFATCLFNRKSIIVTISSLSLGYGKIIKIQRSSASPTQSLTRVIKRDSRQQKRFHLEFYHTLDLFLFSTFCSKLGRTIAPFFTTLNLKND